MGIDKINAIAEDFIQSDVMKLEVKGAIFRRMIHDQ